MSATWIELVETNIEIQDFSRGVGRSGLNTASAGLLDRRTAYLLSVSKQAAYLCRQYEFIRFVLKRNGVEDNKLME